MAGLVRCLNDDGDKALKDRVTVVNWVGPMVGQQKKKSCHFAMDPNGKEIKKSVTTTA